MLQQVLTAIGNIFSVGGVWINNIFTSIVALFYRDNDFTFFGALLVISLGISVVVGFISLLINAFGLGVDE